MLTREKDMPCIYIPLLHAPSAQCHVHDGGHADSRFHPGQTYFYRPPPTPRLPWTSRPQTHPCPSDNDQPQLQPCARHSGNSQSRHMLSGLMRRPHPYAGDPYLAHGRLGATTLADLRQIPGFIKDL